MSSPSSKTNRVSRRRSKGAHHPAAADVNLLRQLLDRYKFGFSIVKELVQNADDAKATTLWIGQSPGLETAQHPLLRGPAVFAVNDGPLRPTDVDSICAFGLTNKASDTDKIGRFGLGLKSVFHLCELFFFVADQEPGAEVNPGEAGAPWGDVMNMWSEQNGGDALHPDWDEIVAEDLDAIATACADMLQATKGPQPDHWLCFWLPLRSKGQSGKRAPIVPLCPLEDGALETVLGPETGARLAGLMPMLANVKRIIHVGPDSHATVELSPEAGRRWRLTGEPAARQQGLSGQITIRDSELGGDNAAPSPVRFVGFEQELNNPELTALTTHKLWPWSSAYDNLGGIEDSSAKAHAHGAAVLLWKPAQIGRLRIFKAVFLPLGDEPWEIGLDVPWDVTLVLHGYLFSNESRDDAEVEPDVGSADPRRAWNSLLFQRATLPAVIHALERLVPLAEDVRLVTAVTKAIAASSLGSSLWQRGAVCADSSWVLRLHPGGSKGWVRVPANTAIHEFPPSAGGAAPPVAALQGLKRLCSDVVVTVREWPRLTPEPATANWSAAHLAIALQGAADVPDALPWVVDLFESALEALPIGESPSTLAAPWAAFVRATLRSFSGKIVDGNQLHVLKRLVALLPAKTRVSLACASSDRQPIPAIFAPILGEQGANRIPVPRVLSNQEDEPQLSSSDAEVLVAALAAEPGGVSETSDLACKIVARCAEADLIDRVKQLHVFACRPPDVRMWRFASLSELDSRAQAGLVFLAGGDPLLVLLSEALEADCPLVVGHYVSELLTGVDPPTARSLRAFLAVVTPPLASLPARVGLLRALTSDVPVGGLDGMQLRGLRFLLHGRAEDDATTCLLAGSDAEDGLWSTLTERALDLMEESWRWLPADAVAVLAKEAQIILNVRPVDNQSVAGLLKRCGASRLPVADIVPADCERILREWSGEPAVLGGLRIHAVVGSVGGRIAVAPDVRVQGTFDPKAGDEPHLPVRLLRRSSDAVVVLRQLTLADELDPSEALRFACSLSDPHLYWRTIVRAVSDLASTRGRGKLPPEVKEALWVPLPTGGAVRHRDLVHLDGVDELLARILPAPTPATTDPVPIGHLALEVREALLSDGVRNDLALPSPDLAALGRALARLPDWQIGSPSALGIVVGDVPLELLAEWLEVFSRVEPELLPAYPFLHAIHQTDPVRAAKIFGRLAGPVGSVDRLDALLRAIQAEHGRSARDRRSTLVSWFARYLRVAREQGEIDDLLELDLQLPSQDGTWRTPGELCHPDMGDEGHDIAPSHLLGHGLNAIVPRPTATVTARTPLRSRHGDDELTDQEIRESASRLDKLLARWQGLVPDECLGAFVALLGDDPEMLQLAKSYLGDRTVEGVRAQVGWRDVPGGLAGMDETIDITMAKQRFVIEVRDVEQLTLPNLRGQPTQFPVRKVPKNFIVSRSFQGEKGRRVNKLVLRPVTADALADEDSRIEFLLATAQEIMSWIYNRSQNKLEALFAQLRQTDQINLDVAQELILSSAHDTFRLTHNAVQVPDLQGVIRDLDAAIAREAEARRGDDPRNMRRAVELIEGHRQTLRERLADPEDPWSRALLDTARERIKDYQYRPSAIPFELLQNADDAGSELDAMRREIGAESPSSLDGARRFVVLIDSERIAVLHWGRPVNCHRLQTWDGGRKLGYDRDLKKMLSFAASDKTLGDCPRNGCFGLGFKSTLLATGRPTVLSDRIHFAVSGGRFPIPLKQETVVRLRADLERRTVPGPFTGQGTIIELPLESEQDGLAALERFRQLGSLVVLFTLWIDSIDLIDDTGPKSDRTSFSRMGSPIPGAPGLERTKVLIDKKGQVGRELLVFRCDSGVVVLALGEDCFQRLPDEVPTFWAMAPTDQRLRAGFVLNAKFILDPGRTQLASNSAKNRGIAARLGRAFGRELGRLHQRTNSDWAPCREALGLSGTASPDDFWESLWGLLSAAGTSGSPLEPFVWGIGAAEPGALPTLAQERAVLPTQLHGHGRFTSAPAVRQAANDLLSRRDVATVIGGWPGVCQEYPPGSIVSSGVWEKIPPIGRAALGIPARLPRLGLTGVISCELGAELCCTPDVARRLAALVGGGGVVRWHEGSADDSWQDSLREVRFRAGDGRWTTADQLLSLATEPDLIPFTPEARRLSDDYDRAAQVFFQACRRARRGDRLDAQEVAGWFRAAQDGPARTAALRFLAQGEWSLRSAVFALLRTRPPEAGDWWRTESAQFLIDDQLGQDAPIVQAMLAATTSPNVPASTAGPAPRDSRRCLEAIASWWDGARDEEISQYERWIYRGRLPVIDPAADLSEQTPRREWIRLLLLGGLHRLGRTRPFHHGSYLDLCDRRGWLDLFAAHHPNREAWVCLIEEYLDNSIADMSYFQWVSQLVTAFQLSRWLEPYAQGFLLMGEFETPSLQAVLSQRNYPELQFTGIDAPSAARALSLGANFVTRELVRLGIVPNRPALHPLCFLPRRAVRRLIAALGGPSLGRSQAPYETISRAIHSFLVEHLGPERATFGGCFDLPLGIVAESADLRAELFGTTIRVETGHEGDLDEEDL